MKLTRLSMTSVLLTCFSLNGPIAIAGVAAADANARTASTTKAAATKSSGKEADGYECVISGGSAGWGSRAIRPKGEAFAIKANAPGNDMAFDRWVGNIEFLADPLAAETTLRMPGEFPFHNVHIAAAYKRTAPKRLVHALFQDHMVLQRGVKAPVWGWTQAGREVTVDFAGQTVKATAGADGRWMVRFEPLQAGGPQVMNIAAGPGESRTIKDVMVGDVWLCSGQSNMAGSGPAAEDAATANLPDIRLFNDDPGANEYDGAEAFDDIADAKSRWAQCSPETAKHWSRVAFYFGRSIHDQSKVPLGLIVSAMDGSFIEAWMPEETISTLPEYLVDGKFRANYNLSWGGGQMPFVRFNARIAPLGPYAMKGVLWYQGESNGSLRTALRYRDLLELMIRDWRVVLQQDDLPFVIVQMHLFGKLDTKRPPDEHRVPWAELEESQWAVATKVPHVGCAVTYDFGREQSLHPPDKKNICERAALVARKVAYGEDVVCYGPIYKEMKIEGNAIRIFFDNLGGGLVAKGGEPLKHITIAGADQKWVWADTKIDGDTIVVSSPKVKEPVAVRYAWGGGQNEANLFNKAGLPAPLFRTDH